MSTRSARYEGGWWGLRSGQSQSVAHVVLVRVVVPEIRSDSLLLACGADIATTDARPKLPTDHLCLRCYHQTAKTPEARHAGIVKWLPPAGHDLNCKWCSGVIPAGESLAYVPGPGHGALLCVPCGSWAQEAAGAT